MSIDQQMAAVLQQLSGLPPPDFDQLNAAQYRAFADNMLPQLPSAPMAEVRPLRVPGAEGQLDARLYRPLARADLPLLVFFHGGGFVVGNLDTHDGLCRELARQTEAVVVSVAYRLAPEAKFPAAPMDCYQATCWLVEHAGELGLDASRLAVAGDSAGANLAIAVSRLAATRQGPKICHQCLFYPVADACCDSLTYETFAEGYFLTRAAMQWFWGHYLSDPSQVDDPLVSTARAEDLACCPPTTLLTAEFDPLRAEGEMLGQRLLKAGVATRLLRCEGLTHGFLSVAPFVERTAEVMALAAGDLRKALNRCEL